MARWLAEGARRQAKGLTRSCFHLAFPLPQEYLQVPQRSRELQTTPVDPGQESPEVTHAGSSVSSQRSQLPQAPCAPWPRISVSQALVNRLSGAHEDRPAPADTLTPPYAGRHSLAPSLRSAQDADPQGRHGHQDIRLPPSGDPVPPAHKAA